METTDQLPFAEKAKTWRVQWRIGDSGTWKLWPEWADIPDEEWLREEDAQQRLKYWETRGFPLNFRIVESQ